MDGISIQGRSTQGVSVMSVGPGDSVGSVATIEMAPEQGAATAEGPVQKTLPGAEEPSVNGESGSTKKADPKAKASGAGKVQPQAEAEKPPAKSSKDALSKADAAMKKAEATLKKTKTNGRRPPTTRSKK